MTKFYFHVHNGDLISDGEGTELPDVISARREATRCAGKLLEDHPEHAWGDGGLSVEVTDAHGLVVFKVLVIVVSAPVVLFEKPVP